MSGTCLVQTSTGKKETCHRKDADMKVVIFQCPEFNLTTNLSRVVVKFKSGHLKNIHIPHLYQSCGICLFSLHMSEPDMYRTW